MQAGPLDATLSPNEPLRPFDERYAAAVLVTHEGKYIVQQRPTDENIFGAGMISLFGGGQEPDEDARACAVRELNEELSIVANPKALELLGYVDKRETNGKLTRCTIFKLKDVDETQLRLHEGKAIVVEDGAVLLERNDVTPVAKQGIYAALHTA